MSSSSFSLTEPRATDEQLAVLYDNISVNDVITPDARCPDGALPAFLPEEPGACYRLTWQLYRQKVDIRVFRRLILRIMVQGKVTPDQALDFKHTRARFKHLRFACANCDERHSYPWLLHFVTRQMGFFQDVFRHGRKLMVIRCGLLLLVGLSPPVWWLLNRRLEDFRPASPQNFSDYLARERGRLAEAVENDTPVTGHQFHGLRKIISRLVALNDTRRVLRPLPELDELAVFLASLNGLMGSKHDDLVEEHLTGVSDYRKYRFPLPEAVASAIRTLIHAGWQRLPDA
ncbi:hypothetical protein LOC54_02585 [Acetobacter sp. AN02]|uniref:hypothetical protein n=1 Tax=Acetobacter sp. AN02 TaxID=2894186 RepID=UPI0024346343|nr:hypothetical protein [Acetobacter sp. AN02]MDG6094010.1 hypothetical protein [Acetobacter sp. AN02]